LHGACASDLHLWCHWYESTPESVGCCPTFTFSWFNFLLTKTYFITVLLVGRLCIISVLARLISADKKLILLPYFINFELAHWIWHGLATGALQVFSAVLLLLRIALWGIKTHRFFYPDLKKGYPVLTIFGPHIHDATIRQMVVQFPTSPNICFCTTWEKQNRQNVH